MPEKKVEHPLFLDYGRNSHSADHGSLWLVEIEHNTDEWGIEVDVSSPDHPRTLHGPFATEEEAVEWMETYPDDEDIFDMEVIVLNKVRP